MATTKGHGMSFSHALREFQVLPELVEAQVAAGLSREAVAQAQCASWQEKNEILRSALGCANYILASSFERVPMG